MVSRLSFLLFFPLLISACAGINPRATSSGFLYNDTEYSLTGTSNVAGNRVGEACSSSILGLVAWGDTSIETARRNGGITMITSIDESFLNYGGVYSKSCVILRGR